MILCLGRSTFEAVISALAPDADIRITDYNAFIESSRNPVPVRLENSVAHVFALAHCGAMGTLNRNNKESADLTKQIDDWRRIRKYIAVEENDMFHNKVIVITGGAGGIGKTLAEEFRKAGGHVCVIDCAPGDHFVGDIGDKAVLEAFADSVIRE